MKQLAARDELGFEKEVKKKKKKVTYILFLVKFKANRKMNFKSSGGGRPGSPSDGKNEQIDAWNSEIFHY